MVVLLIGLAVVTVVLSLHTVLVAPAIISAVLAFWSNGVLANFRTDPQSAPNWAASISMLTALASIGLLIAALLIR